MAKLGEANIGGRLVPAWLLDTPAKYLDGDLPVIQANDDLDSYTTPGEYIQGNTSVVVTLVNFPVNLPRGEMCLKVSSLGVPGYVCQEIKAKDGLKFSRAIRFSNNGVFQPWEYEDPELSLGVEYRTTERYQGKPVYVMAKNYGLVQKKNTEKTASIPENAGYGWVVNGEVTYYGIPIPSWNNDGSLRFGASYNQGSGSISFIANEDRVNTNAKYVLTIKYVKTTD